MVKNIKYEKLVAVLSYFLIGIIWYFVDKEMRESKLVKFHVKQSLNLYVFNVILAILYGFLYFLIFIWMILDLGLTILWIFGLVYAFKEETKEIPLIGQFAEKYLTF